MSEFKTWTLRPPMTEEEGGGTDRPVVSMGPPISEWTTVVDVEAVVAAIRGLPGNAYVPEDAADIIEDALKGRVS